MELQIPLADGTLSQVFIVRATGKIFGPGVLPENRLRRPFRRLRMAVSEYQAAQQFGRGTWYNSDSRIPSPRFAQPFAPKTTLSDGLHYGFAAGTEVELIVAGSRGTLRTNAGKYTIDLSTKRIEDHAGFVLLSLEEIPDLSPNMIVYPPQAIEIGVYADHLANLIQQHGPVVALPQESVN